VVSPEENDLLTRIGPGTRMGALLRRYWQPIGTSGEMLEKRAKRVRLLGENLVLAHAADGGFALVEESFPRGVAPASYPVGELGGLLWAYLGPLPAPLIPRLDGFVAEGTIRILGTAVIPCNWLQIMENSLDAVHTEWLHGHFFEFIKENEGLKVSFTQRHVKIGFDEFEYGIVKRRVLEGHTEDDDDWKIGHPVVFPNTLAIGNASPAWHEYRFQIRVPVDDTHTKHYWFGAFVLPEGATAPPHLLDRVHEYETPIFEPNGEFMLDSIHGQDIMAWVSQGAIADRSRESLGSTDRGITLYRRMLLRELKALEEGRDPKNVVRDPARNGTIVLPLEGKKAQRSDGFEVLFRRHQVRYSPIAEEILAVLRSGRAPELVAAS
jgi:5,5'-dehydrodivanillate O-demethylase